METAQSTDRQDRGPSITCFPSGKQFYINFPTFDIEDIAHALGMTCRFNGHVRHFYSVAEHSVIVALLMQELALGDPMEGLLHDAHEAYVGDIVAPWKDVINDWRVFEQRLEEELRDYFRLPASKTAGCRQADRLALHIESWFLKVRRGEIGSRPGDSDADEDRRLRAIAQDLIDKQHWRTLNLLPSEATAAFLKHYNFLRS
ncbi:MAG: hypothetical protein A3E01_07045 [Gammaproteobacteria bacterium RIFCSPHIGHO2_12_FULL_63_22]|nr:MAG: hypothetical protein A3E01_07045 [Gammaproteobacteria bacterium RIFCSPHIGHO2_12_FULL_63_22]